MCSRPFLIALLAMAPFLQGAATRADSLEARLNTLLDSSLVKGAAVSLDIVEIMPRGSVSLFSHDATTPLGPASNLKLLTTAAAFERYGPNATFKTQLFKIGDDLILLGGGDPGLGDSKLSGQGGGATAVFQAWAQHLGQLGLTQFRDLIVDDRIFDTQFTHPNWPPKDALAWFSAPVGGLNFNDNCLDWTPKLTPHGISVELSPETSYVSLSIKATRAKSGDSNTVYLYRAPTSNDFQLRGALASSASMPEFVNIYDPGLWTGTVLKDTLARNGISITGKVRRPGSAEHFPTGTLLASNETPILSVIKRANTNSLNMMAEALCKRLGYDSTGEPGSWASGTAAVKAYAVALGAKSDWLSLDDGSGLSNKNRVAAKAFTTVLSHIAARPDAQRFFDTLAVPGEDGTLEKRFKSAGEGMSVASHVRGKTGHISGVSSLSGYITVEPKGESRTGDRVFAFSILVNKYQGNVNPWQDQVCQAIYEWAGGK